MTATPRPSAAYAAALWCLVFAAASFYWAAGGTFGLGTLALALGGVLFLRAAPRRCGVG